MKIITFLLPALLVALPLMAAEPNVAGNWQANVFGSKVKANVEQSGASIRGVAHVYKLFGGKDTYHFTGGVDQGRVTASHPSGYVFTGTMLSANQVRGVLTLRDGKRIDILAKRR